MWLEDSDEEKSKDLSLEQLIFNAISESIQALEAAITDSDIAIQLAATRGLAGYGEPEATPGLIKALKIAATSKPQNEAMKEVAIDGLRQLGAIAVHNLLEELESEDESILAALVDCLGTMTDLEDELYLDTVNAMLDMASHQNMSVRLAGIRAIGQLIRKADEESPPMHDTPI